MTIYEFAKLNINEKATTTCNGTFLAHREKENIKYALYAVENFFVEVTYDAMDNEILNFAPSQTKRLLDEYLNDIQLDI
mgnify:CR=1 FL=1